MASKQAKDKVPKVVPDGDEPAQEIVPPTPEVMPPKQPQQPPSQSLVNVNVNLPANRKRAGVVKEHDGPVDSDRQFDMGDIFGSDDTPMAPDPLDTLMSEENINMKTELTEGLIMAIAVAEVYADEFQIPQLKSVCHKMKTMRVSLGRKGRMEIVEAIKGHPPPAMDDPASFAQRFKNALHT